MNEWFADIAFKFQLAFVEGDRWKLYLKGLGVTLQISLFAAILGVVIGTIVALMKLSVKKGGKRTFISVLAQAYIDIIRGTPSVLQLLIMWFIIMEGCKNGILVAVLTFGINSGAYVAEIMRAGILAVDHGQMEAGRSLGLSKSQTMRYVILSDLTRTASQVSSRTFEAFMPLIGAAVIYFIIIKILSKLIELLERRLRKGDHR